MMARRRRSAAGNHRSTLGDRVWREFELPWLLELSGISTAPLLQKHSVPMLIDPPGIGENLQDHCMSTVKF